MKIVYFGNHHNTSSDDTEGHLTKAFESLGHEVVRVGVSDKTAPQGDILLFHKQYPNFEFKGPKYCWYFDKLWNGRDAFLKACLERCEKIFLTDETWARARPNPKIQILRQGIGNSSLGSVLPLVDAQIAFTGTLYSQRYDWVGELAKRYGRKFQVFDGVHNKDFRDLCASVPIFVCPPYPSDDYYWSNRVYLTTGSGGFLIHPRLKGLELEYEDKKEIVYYDNEVDLFKKIDYYLAFPDEREKIRLAGWQKTKSEFTYLERVKVFLASI